MSTITGISSVTPAQVIKTARTAATAAASSTATPYDSGNITTWQLPGFPTQKLVNGSQSFSTKAGEVFTDFAQGLVVTPSTDVNGSTLTYSLQAGTPANND
jgi:hypothetical protein